MGPREQDASRGEGVDVRRLRLRMSAEASDPIVQIVDSEKKYVWSGFRSAGERD